MGEHPLITRQQAAKYLGLSVATLDRLTKQGHIQAVKVGPHTVRYTAEALAEALKPVKAGA